jgi:hypothetical protein
MATLEEEIKDLKAKIAEYEQEYANASTSEERKELRPLITAKEARLLFLLQQQQQQQAQAGGGQVDEEAQIALIKRAYREMDAEKTEKSVVMSNVSAATLDLVLHRFNMVVTEDNALPTDDVFPPFDWNNRDEDNAEAFAEVFKHIHANLIKIGVPIEDGSGTFKLCDVHLSRTFLNVDDDKVGKMRGGCDLAIVPSSTAAMSLAREIIIIFELKTEVRGYKSSCNQAVVELLAAKCLSHQPNVLVVLTDVATGAIAFHVQWHPDHPDDFSVKQWNIDSLGAMAQLVKTFLNDWGRAKGDFIPHADSEDQNELQVINFKKRKLSSGITSTVEWEHFSELREDTEPNSLERVNLTRQLFSSWGVERMPSLLNPSMYV